MGRKDSGYYHHHHQHQHYHHHKPNHSRGSSKHNRQHQQHGTPSSQHNSRSDQSYQLPQFIPVQQLNLCPQFDTAIFNQRAVQMQNQQQQMYFNQPVQYNPNVAQTNIMPETSNWFDPYPQNLSSAGASTSTNSLPLEQAIPAAALSSLQLPASQITETGIIPNMPYYDLPAGLMVPLIVPTQNDYISINPGDLRLPLPKFPDENFLRTIDAYYGLSDGRQRDNDGWDREFIDTYISKKVAQ